MRRNFRFWSRYILEGTGGVIYVLAALFVVFLLYGYEYGSLMTILAELPYILFLASCLLLILMSNVIPILYTPLLVSMGETRRNVYISSHLCKLVIVCVTVLLCAGIWAIVPENIAGTGLESLPTLFVVLLIVSSVGGILGTLFVKFKRFGSILMLIIYSGTGGVIGGSAASGHLSDIVAWVMDVSHSLPWWLLLVAAVLLAVDLSFHWLVLRQREVRL